MDHPVAQRRLATLNSQLNPSTDDVDVLHLEPQETLAAWTYISSGFRTTWAVRIADWRNNWSFTNVFENSAWHFPDNPCIFFEDAKYTYTEVNEFSNQIAHWAHDDLSIKPGDVVALIMENRPEFLWTWIGLAKAGATIAFINYKLHGASLVHVLDTAQAKAYIVGSELVDTFMAVYKHKVGDCYVYFGNHGIGQKDQIPASMKVLDAHIQDLATRYENSSKKEGSATQSGLKMISKNPPKEWSTLITINSPLWLIYTSGTTGFPKAARVTHRNVLARTHILYGMSHATSADRIYCCLPLYHSSGSTISLLVWYAGGAIILRRQFSAKEFMEDCRRYGATLFVYIGELCRYIHATPESQDDKTHNIRMGIGNGLRPDIWAKFQNRFGIPLIMELYASTEGTSMVNLYNKVGAIGYLPWLIRKAAFTGKLIKYDVETDNHIRDKNGFCIECGPNEPGELITDMDASPRKTVTSGGTFTGYTDEKATEKKILRDVFQKGDRWFRTGDLIKMDDQGFFYFVDRIGDTFRWKGENVSTNEVAEVMSVFPGIAEVNVYGVQVPHNEGRCGMASIVLEKPGTEVDWKKLYAHLETNLPGYAHPQFIRLQQEIDKTSTFKFKKVEYAKEAFHLDGVKDPIFVRDEVNRTFVQLDNSLYNAIIHGKARL